MVRKTAEEITRAVDGVLSGEFKSSWEAWKKTGVSRQTIDARLKGSQTPKEAHGSQQKLSPKIEKELVNWILLEDRAGNAPTYARIRSMAADILEANRQTRELGECWHTNFISRHNEIKASFARKVDKERIKSCTIAAINDFFKRFDSIQTEFKCAPSNI